MEIMYSNKNYELFDKKITCIYGDKLDLINMNYEFNGINYDDEWTVKRFLNGNKIQIDKEILEIFNEIEIKESLLKKKINELSKGEFKLVLFVYILLNNKEIVVFDYFDKCLSFKYKKRIINYIKTKYDGKLVFISNDLVFLNTLSNYIVIFKDGKIIFNDEFNKLYKSKKKIEYPSIINFINLANKKGAKLSYTVDRKELLKDIYRSVR